MLTILCFFLFFRILQLFNLIMMEHPRLSKVYPPNPSILYLTDPLFTNRYESKYLHKNVLHYCFADKNCIKGNNSF